MFLAKIKKVHTPAIITYENLTVSQFVHIEQIAQIAVFEVWEKDYISSQFVSSTSWCKI